MDIIKEFFPTSPYIAWSIVSVLAAMIVIVALWEKVSWWWFNTWMSFPLIGRIARLAKDFNMDSVDRSWFKAEKALCRDYKKFIRIQDEHDFNNNIDYLTKAGDNGRTSMPSWIWMLTVALVFAGFMGFSYVFSGFLTQGISETIQQYYAVGFTFIISVLLVVMTHFSGHELYVSNKIKHARREWTEDGRKHEFRTRAIPLDQQQSIDDDQPSYTQLANRVGTHVSYTITIVTVAFVLSVTALAAVAPLTTSVRGQVSEKELHQGVVGASNKAELNVELSVDRLDTTIKEGVNPVLPDADVTANQAIKDKAVMDEVSINRHSGWGIFVVLAFFFMFSYKRGFAGRHSEAAFRAIGKGRYSSYSEMRDHYNEVVDIAQSKLEALQQKLEDNSAYQVTSSGKHTTNTFRQFMEMERQEDFPD